MTALLRRLVVAPDRNLDLVIAWLLSIVLHPMIPHDHYLANPNLVPWLTICMVVVAFRRARSLGDGPPSGLTERKVSWANALGRLGLMTSPIALMAWFDLGADLTRFNFYLAIGLSLATVVFTAAGRIHGETAWKAPGTGIWWRQALRGGLTITASLLLGACYGLLDEWSIRWFCVAALLGLQFHTLGLLPDRFRNRWQRAASGLRDGSPYRPPRFGFLLALLGPSGGLALLLLLHELLLSPPVSFDQGTVISLHVFAWAAVVWAPPLPIAVSCVLHEVVPDAGKDPNAGTKTVAFERPPSGALRLNPIGVKRLRVVHHWVVPVNDPRIEDLDDPIRPLWPRPPLPVSQHVLGEASFEPNPATQIPQWHTITIRFEDQRDVNQLGAGGVQTRRLAILRAFPSRGQLGGPRAVRTYRWDQNLAAATIQVVDATTELITMQDGDIIVLSSEGVARAFELEIGALIFDQAQLGVGRPPQLEDYVGVT